MMDIKNDYKMTDLGEIPSEWEIYPLKEVTSQIGDGNYSSKYPKSADFIESGIPFLRANNLKNGKLSMKDMKYISLEQHESLKKGHIKVGDIIITVRGQIGNVAITTKEFDDVNINAQLAFLRFNDQISSKFILYFLQSTLIQNLLFSITTGTALQQLPINRLNNLRIIVPPLNEQQKIAEILSTVDEQIEQTNQLIEKTVRLKKGLMQELLTKGIGHTRFRQTGLGEIPVEWEVSKLGKYVRLQAGYAFKSSKFSDTGIRILRISNIQEGGLSLRECKYYSHDDVVGLDDYYLTENDTVIAMSGATTGKSALVKKHDLPLLVNQRVGIFRPKREEKVDPLFIYYTISSDYYQLKIWDHAIGGAQPNISSSQLESIVIAYPPLKEQKKIVEILSTVDEKIEGYKEEKAKYEELKQGLMQQLLTGKIRVKV